MTKELETASRALIEHLTIGTGKATAYRVRRETPQYVAAVEAALAARSAEPNAVMRVTGCTEGHEEWQRDCDVCWDALAQNAEELLDMAADEVEAGVFELPATKEKTDE